MSDDDFYHLPYSYESWEFKSQDSKCDADFRSMMYRSLRKCFNDGNEEYSNLFKEYISQVNELLEGYIEFKSMVEEISFWEYAERKGYDNQNDEMFFIADVAFKIGQEAGIFDTTD